MSRVAHPLPRTWLVAASLLLALPAFPAAPGPGEPVKVEYGEIDEHLIGEYPRVTTAWEDITRDRRQLNWSFNVIVDDSGAVSLATLKKGSQEFRDEAQKAIASMRFKPFVRDGRPVWARLELNTWSRPADYSGPATRDFPANPDLATTVIALSRSGCLGACPSYRVELRGNGEVRYEGDSDVLVKGSHRWRVDPASLAPLLEIFRRANYFALDGYYEYPVTDLPTFVTRLRRRRRLDVDARKNSRHAARSLGDRERDRRHLRGRELCER
jgi:hypothetical protein